MGHLEGLSATDIARLRARWLGTNTLEARLVEAFDAINRCWKCQATLLVDTHPNCEDCPEYPGEGPEVRPREGDEHG